MPNAISKFFRNYFRFVAVHRYKYNILTDIAFNYSNQCIIFVYLQLLTFHRCVA